MPPLTSAHCWQHALDSLLPPAAALLSAIALWVASRARSTFTDVRSTLQENEGHLLELRSSLARSESRPVARDRRKSSTKVTTYTSPGEHTSS